MGQSGLDRASATLARGTRFLGAGLRTVAAGAPPGAISESGRAKLIANSLRELDRFLNLLIEEVAAAIAPPGFDASGFARLRNTPNKLRSVRAAMGLPSPDHERLRGIGRARDCLFHCAPMPRRGDRRPSPCRLDLAERLTPGAEVLAELCRFYDGVAAELLAACRDHVAGRLPVEASA